MLCDVRRLTPRGEVVAAGAWLGLGLGLGLGLAKGGLGLR